MLPILFRFPDWIPILGGEPITTFGVAMFLAFLTAAWIHRKEMARVGLDPDKTWDLLFSAVVGGILGAKLYYVLLNFDLVLADPRFLFARGGLVWYGGFLLATLLVALHVRRLKLPLPLLADLTAPALALAYAVGRVGCFLVGDDYGRPTASWVGVRFPEGAPPTTVEAIERTFGVQVDPALVERFGQVVPVHPTQLYEVGMSLLIFAFLWRIRVHRHRPGWLFMVWLALAGVERFVVEMFRVKDDRFFGPLTLAQVISIGLLVTGVVGALRLARGASARPATAAT
ncbi:MAG: prolipoprotein diacylglyceryl transferase [Gemmatimonadota bacterium]|nr:prolipoprotein diacylglyceryl transferase [Gemmatimonadota bacterium]